MMARLLVAGCAGLTVCAGLLLFARVSQAQTAAPAVRPTVTERAAQRQEIRQTPLLERPNRPGHFYGNTVRRLRNLQFGRN
ncbi:MAG: hypothetical protein ACLQNE_35590 [Thermoguttaceae bacterium]